MFCRNGRTWGSKRWVRLLMKSIDIIRHPDQDLSSDRLAEAFAERFTRSCPEKNYWGYARQESLDVNAILKEGVKWLFALLPVICRPEHSEKKCPFFPSWFLRNTPDQPYRNFDTILSATASDQVVLLCTHPWITIISHWERSGKDQGYWLYQGKETNIPVWSQREKLIEYKLNTTEKGKISNILITISKKALFSFGDSSPLEGAHTVGIYTPELILIRAGFQSLI